MKTLITICLAAMLCGCSPKPDARITSMEMDIKLQRLEIDALNNGVKILEDRTKQLRKENEANLDRIAKLTEALSDLTAMTKQLIADDTEARLAKTKPR